MSTDYSKARFFALGSMGYGKGFDAEEAVENYVKTQVRNHRIKDLIFKTKAEFETYLRSNVEVFKAPDDFAPGFSVGFIIGFGTRWTRTDDDGKIVEYREFRIEDKVSPII